MSECRTNELKVAGSNAEIGNFYIRQSVGQASREGAGSNIAKIVKLKNMSELLKIKRAVAGSNAVGKCAIFILLAFVFIPHNKNVICWQFEKLCICLQLALIIQIISVGKFPLLTDI